MKTGYIVYICSTGKLPIVLSFEDTAELATAAALTVASDVGIDVADVPAPIHVDCHKDRNDFAYEEWLLIGRDYAIAGDVAVRHGTKPLT